MLNRHNLILELDQDDRPPNNCHKEQCKSGPSDCTHDRQIVLQMLEVCELFFFHLKLL